MARSLLQRLGYRSGTPSAVIDRPDGIAGLEELSCAPEAQAAFVLAFVADAAAIARIAPELSARYVLGGHLWLAYPKKSGAIRTDISRDQGFEPLMERGFLPVAQVAIDETWSALRFRRRAEIRKLTRAEAR